MLLSRRAFAKSVGVSHTYINRLVKNGVIPLHNGKVDLDEGRRCMEENKDPSRDAQRDANARMKKDKKDEGLWDKSVLPSESIADMTPEEREEYDRQLFAEQERLRDAQEKAKSAGIDVGLEKTPNSLNKVKIFRELYMGKIAQLEFKKKSGELVEKSEVERDGYEAGRLIRDNLLNFSHKMSMKVAALSDPKEIEAILESEIHQILEQISNVKN